MRKDLVSAGLAVLTAVLWQASPAQAKVSGAIFTTVVDGTIVNANTQYASKCDVYLDGGPGPNAPASAAGLPAGDYYFQVTDPSGQTLLSTDPVSNRRFTVSAAGVIVAFVGTGGPAHPTGIDQDHPELGAITIRMANASCPTDYLNTPNGGGVYKVWVTPVSSFIGDPTLVDNACGNGCYHGFASSASKTDNFKVNPNLATFCLSVAKQIYDGATNTLTPGFSWPLTLTDPTEVNNPYYTNTTDGTISICGLAAGSYTISEANLPGYAVVGLIVNGVPLPVPQTLYSFTWLAGQPDLQVVFQNQVQLF